MDAMALLHDLIRRRSVTPDDAGCQALIGSRLVESGFRCLNLDDAEVSNLFACHGDGAPLLVFLGHTDVVPTGPESQWRHPPFEPTEDDGVLYGRGSADMKGSVAAMVVALERFVADHPGHPGQVGLLLTSDEEGPAEHGIRTAVPALEREGIRIDYCLVGEPSSREVLGDQIRIGRRGSLNGFLTVQGVQGHSAFPELADNPLHALAPALAELCATTWDGGCEGFPATGLQVTNLNAGTGATNVIPGQAEVVINFRYNPASSFESLTAAVEAILDRHGVRYTVRWQDSGRPFVTREPTLKQAVVSAIERHCARTPEANTGGGTSDGRFVAPAGAEVVELGPVNASIHKIDENVRVEDVETLVRIYQTVLEEVLL